MIFEHLIPPVRVLEHSDEHYTNLVWPGVEPAPRNFWYDFYVYKTTTSSEVVVEPLVKLLRALCPLVKRDSIKRRATLLYAEQYAYLLKKRLYMAVTYRGLSKRYYFTFTALQGQ